MAPPPSAGLWPLAPREAPTTRTLGEQVSGAGSQGSGRGGSSADPAVCLWGRARPAREMTRLHLGQVEADGQDERAWTRPLQDPARRGALLPGSSRTPVRRVSRFPLPGSSGTPARRVSGMRNASKELPGATSRYAPCGECPAQGAVSLCCWTAPRPASRVPLDRRTRDAPKERSTCVLLCPSVKARLRGKWGRGQHSPFSQFSETRGNRNPS